MIKRLLSLFAIIIAASGFVFSQQGALKGKISDKDTKEGIPFASVALISGGKQFAATTTDFDGNFTIKPITPGKYDLQATYVGYNPALMKGIIISADQTVFQDIKLSSSVKQLEQVEVTDYKVPLIQKDQTETQVTVTAEEIAKMPGRDASSVASTVGGVSTDENGGIGGIRGARAEGTSVYVDGVRSYLGGLPQSALEQVTVITGGTPAKYGDATGGVINVTTKGPSRNFAMGGQYETSELIDNQHANLLGFSMQGPLILGKDSTKSTSLLGFFLAGEFNSSNAGATALTEYTVNPTLLNKIQNSPLRLTPTSTGTYVFPSAEYITDNDLVKVNKKPNTYAWGGNMSAKIDVRTTSNTNLTFGVNGNYSDGLAYIRANQLLNYENNPEVLGYNYRLFGRFTQRFPTDKNSKSSVKNVYYTIEADYSATNSTTQDATHKDDLFKYGYLGSFTTYRAKGYAYGYDSYAKKFGYLMTGYIDTLYAFKQAGFNKTTGNYTQQYYDLFPANSAYYTNSTTIQSMGALLNGQEPPSVYGLWNGTGYRRSTYSKSKSNQFEINASGSADIKNHAIEFGLLYQQQTNRGYSVNAFGLWTLMRQLVNKQIIQLNKTNPNVKRDVYGVYQDTIDYNRIYTKSEQSYFDINLRNSLGLSTNYIDNNPNNNLSEWKQDWIDIDSYDPNSKTVKYYDINGVMKTAHLSKDLNINMFSADDLINSGHPYVTYSGYDYMGNVLTSKPTFNDFFTKTDNNGNFTREIAPFQPIYMAGYIQDKFAFNDLLFNIGLRIDRYDLNQMVLKDPYLFYNAKTVQDVKNEGGSIGENIPSNMGSNYVVYVDNISKPTKILGYRNGSTWFTSQGTEASDPSTSGIESTNGIQPYLKDPNNQVLNSSSFTQYVPQITYMPRISFSFPISDEALFFAHYDVLTQRPTSYSQLDLLSYLYIQDIGTSPINNPNLKPERTVDYELGFQQKLNNSSSLKFSAYYREMRDEIQAFRFFDAYPVTYVSYNNIDFGTVKGLNISYDLRRTSNLSMHASYNLQFADGTGSTPQQAAALVASGLPNFRTTSPLSFDKRHEIKASIDYRYSNGTEYDGPRITSNKGTDHEKTVLLLQNTGINLTFRGGSGLPYTSTNIIGNTINGALNGSRYPWQFALDAKIDRDFIINTKGKFSKHGGKKVSANVYILVLNVLNTKNIVGVYSTTGNPNDDGYLSAAQNQNTIKQQVNEQSYRDLYALYINNPGNYMIPRRIHIGVQFGF